jgi:tetratricopeptide (TPR) repeat protein
MTRTVRLAVRALRLGALLIGAGLLAAGSLGVLLGGRSPYAGLGTWALARGWTVSAERWLSRGQDASPDAVEAPFNLGIALYQQQRFDPAAEAFARALARSRNDTERAAVLFNMASSHASAGRLVQALECLEGSLQANPADDAARYNYTLVKRWLAGNSTDRAQAFSPPPEMTKEEVERLLNQLGAVPLRTKPRQAPTPSGKPDW